MAELVDALDLKSSSLRSVGSTPALNIESLVKWLIRLTVNQLRKRRVFESHNSHNIHSGESTN